MNRTKEVEDYDKVKSDDEPEGSVEQLRLFAPASIHTLHRACKPEGSRFKYRLQSRYC
jgi:hypothetical protein